MLGPPELDAGRVLAKQSQGAESSRLLFLKLLEEQPLPEVDEDLLSAEPVLAGKAMLSPALQCFRVVWEPKDPTATCSNESVGGKKLLGKGSCSWLL